MSKMASLLQKQEWRPVTKAKFVAFSAGLALFILVVLRGEPGFVVLLDGANLLFHEAGHPFIGLFSARLEIYGGTLGQFVFPVIVIVGFWRQGLAVSCAVGWIWFFENFFNVARYMADARAMVLPLVGGGEHDWNSIFIRWNVLDHDTAIAAAVRTFGWVGIGVVWGWLVWRTLSGPGTARTGTTVCDLTRSP